MQVPDFRHLYFLFSANVLLKNEEQARQAATPKWYPSLIPSQMEHVESVLDFSIINRRNYKKSTRSTPAQSLGLVWTHGNYSHNRRNLITIGNEHVLMNNLYCSLYWETYYKNDVFRQSFERWFRRYIASWIKSGI